jgi:F-type H+-transporting ATPase subunit b
VTPRARIGLLLILVCLSIPAAAGPESGSSGMFGKIVNFVILFGGLYLLLRKPIAGMLAQRTKDIEQSLTEARRERRDAELKLEAARSQIADLEAELDRIRTLAQAEGLKEKERIRALARQEAERLRSLAKLEVEAQLKSSIRELKEYTASLAAQLAEAHLKERLTAADHAALIDRSIDKLKTLHEESDAR